MNNTNSYQVKELMDNLDHLYPNLLTNLLTKVNPSYNREIAHSIEEQWNILKSTLLKSEEQRKVYGLNENNIDEVLYGRLKLLTDSWKDFEKLKEKKLKIPEDLTLRLWNVYIPFSEWIVNKRKNTPEDKAYILGINGGQGSGKSTLVDVMKLLLERQGYRTVAISIDDFYKTYNDREELKKSEPRYKFRGVPGTHDVDLTIEIFRKLRDRQAVEIPTFDKSLKNGSGDRSAKKYWQKVKKGVDIVLAEGWFWGIRSLPEKELDKPTESDLINNIERRDDPDGSFLRIVNRALRKYHELFDFCDNLVVLKVPSLEKIREWRKLQEDKMKKERGTGMTDKELNEFLDYFAPTTQRYVLPLDRSEYTDLVFLIGDNHQIKKVISKK